MFMSIIDKAFTKGCGKQMTHFWEKINKQSKKDIEHHNLKTAQTVGPLIFGDLLNRKDENESLRISRKLISRQKDDLSLSNFQTIALLKILGEELIQRATQDLPPAISPLINKWQTNDPDIQINIIKTLFSVMQEKEQATINISPENWSKMTDFQQNFAQGYSADRYLPHILSKPNCLGKVIQMLAIGKLFKAKCYKISVLKQAMDQDIHDSLELFRQTKLDIQSRSLINDKIFEESIDTHAKWFEYLSLSGGYHTCIIMQLCDKRWVIADPHGLIWGILPNNMQQQMSKVDYLLQKYHSVLPGLTLQVSDQDPNSELSAKHHRRHIEFLQNIEESRRVEKYYSSCSSLYDFERVFDEHSFDYLITDPAFSAIKKMIDTGIASRQDAARILLSDSFQRNLSVMMTDENLFYQIIRGEILTLYHCLALDRYYQDFTKDRLGGQIVHPAFEVIDPVFGTAFSVIQNLGVLEDLDIYKDLCQLSNDQLMRRNYVRDMLIRSTKLFSIDKNYGQTEWFCYKSLLRDKVLHENATEIVNIVKINNNRIRDFKKLLEMINKQTQKEVKL